SLHDLLVHLSPFALVELHDMFMDSAESVCMEGTAVGLLPDQVLRQAPVLDPPSRRHEHPQRAEAPDAAAFLQLDLGQPAADGHVPIERGIAIRRIRDRAIHFPKLRDDLPGIATINDDSITLVEGFQARHDSPPRSPGKYTTGNSTRQELDSVNLALSCDQERERHEQCLMKKEDG